MVKRTNKKLTKKEGEERIEELEAECEDLRSQALRAQADYQNLRRRGQADYQAGLQRSLTPLLEELLLVLDYLDLALASPTTTDEARNLALGVEMTRNKFVSALEQSDVKPIATEGSFNPARHEATGTRKVEGVEPGTIVETAQRGYTWHETVLRYAKVIVAAGEESLKETREEPPDEEAEETEPDSSASEGTDPETDERTEGAL